METTCKAAINRVHGMPFDWSLNPYRGCRHGCAYCYARTTHAFLGLNAGDDFDSVIFAKKNIAAVLRAELRRPAWTGAPIAIGTATDPYQPAEGRFRLTRSCLEALAEARNPANVTTKGTLVVRDVDLLQDLARVARCGVNISLITLDETIWRAFELGTPPPAQRLAAMRRLTDAGVPCGLALAPVLPRLTDSFPALEAVVRAAADHGAQWLWSGTLHLEPPVRDWLLAAVDRHFPTVAPAYARVFGAAGAGGGARYAPRDYSEALAGRVNELEGRYGLHRALPTAPRHGQAPATDAPITSSAESKQAAARQPPLPW